MSDIQTFDPTIPKEEVDRLFRKLADTRLPQFPVVPDAGEDYGNISPTKHIYHTDLTRHPRPIPRLDPKALHHLAPHLLLDPRPIPNILLVALHHLHLLADRALHPRAGARAPRKRNTTTPRARLAGYVFRIPERHGTTALPRYTRRAELPPRGAEPAGVLLEPRAAAGVDAAGYRGHV